jgi:hypothetical protein
VSHFSDAGLAPLSQEHHHLALRDARMKIEPGFLVVLVVNILFAGRDPAAVPLREVMTPDPTTVTPDETFGHALDPELEEFAAEAERRKAIKRRG